MKCLSESCEPEFMWSNHLRPRCLNITCMAALTCESRGPFRCMTRWQVLRAQDIVRSSYSGRCSLRWSNTQAAARAGSLPSAAAAARDSTAGSSGEVLKGGRLYGLLKYEVLATFAASKHVG